MSIYLKFDGLTSRCLECGTTVNRHNPCPICNDDLPCCPCAHNNERTTDE